MTKIIKVKAGGVVINEQGQFLVVTRREYGDFSLPKGHLEEGELIHECALREVFEESGWECELGDFIGILEYRVVDGENEVLSQVHYYSMKPISYGVEGLLTDEIALVSWFDMHPEYVEKLTYKGDRDFMSKHFIGVI